MFIREGRQTDIFTTFLVSFISKVKDISLGKFNKKTLEAYGEN